MESICLFTSGEWELYYSVTANAGSETATLIHSSTVVAVEESAVKTELASVSISGTVDATMDSILVEAEVSAELGKKQI